MKNRTFERVDRETQYFGDPFERVLKPKYAGRNEEDLWLEVDLEAAISG
jgi:hypothetical protein